MLEILSKFNKTQTDVNHELARKMINLINENNITIEEMIILFEYITQRLISESPIQIYDQPVSDKK